MLTGSAATTTATPSATNTSAVPLIAEPAASAQPSASVNASRVTPAPAEATPASVAQPAQSAVGAPTAAHQTAAAAPTAANSTAANGSATDSSQITKTLGGNASTEGPNAAQEPKAAVPAPSANWTTYTTKAINTTAGMHHSFS